jgi:predicted HAD superfamily Cof-like phosphohydrolase
VVSASRAAELVATWQQAALLPQNVRMDPRAMSYSGQPLRIRRGARTRDCAELHMLRSKLIGEECREAMDAITGWDKENKRYGLVDINAVAKELCDILYVVYGAADVWGIPLDAALERVHVSNMTKITDDMPVRGDGKILKGDSFRPADFTGLF